MNKNHSESDLSPIKRLGSILAGHTRHSGTRAVLLGAGASISSGLGSWRDVCTRIAHKLSLPIYDGVDPVSSVKTYLRSYGPESERRLWLIYGEVCSYEPSSGYAHLANLVAQGFIDIVLTTNWDPLVEIALARVLRPDQFRVLIRGETTDSAIARAVRRRTLTKVIKLHGDLISGVFHLTDEEVSHLGTELQTALEETLTSELLIVGSSLDDLDLVQFVSSANLRCQIHFVNPDAPVAGSVASAVMRKAGSVAISGTLAEFDTFFREVDFAVQRQLLAPPAWDPANVEREMLSALERGASTISYKDIDEHVQDLARRIARTKPHLLAFVDDPHAPGGTEIMKRISATPLGKVPIATVRIVSNDGSRVMGRTAMVSSSVPPNEVLHITVIDSVAFSGATLSLAAQALAERYPHARVSPALLVASRLVVQRSRTDPSLKGLISVVETDRHDITFPWGSTYSTDSVVRQLSYGEKPRSVNVYRRPWGSGEVFVEQETCSVRLLTIEAHERLSLQRHLCRDELFVALDDDVGFDIAGVAFGQEDITEFDSRIKALTLSAGDYLLVPRGIWHRARARRTRVRLLELGLGIYDEVDDIERRLDWYGRGAPKG